MASRTPATRRPAPHDSLPHRRAARPRGGRTSARFLAAVAAVAGLALVAGPAGATPAATVPDATVPDATTTDATTAAVTTAVQDSPATTAVPRAAYAVTDVRTAAVDPAWAGAALEPTGTDLDPATVVLHLVAGALTVVDLGTAQVGCGAAPAAVAVDLGLGC